MHDALHMASKNREGDYILQPRYPSEGTRMADFGVAT
jgi:hypothetical protein